MCLLLLARSRITGNCSAHHWHPPSGGRAADSVQSSTKNDVRVMAPGLPCPLRGALGGRKYARWSHALNAVDAAASHWICDLHETVDHRRLAPRSRPNREWPSRPPCCPRSLIVL